MELTELYAKVDSELWNTQENYEDMIKKCVEARTNYINCVLEYEKAIADKIRQLYNKDTKVTVVKEIAKFECIELYSKMLHAENVYKKYKIVRDGCIERINTIKFLSRLKFGMIN